MKIPKRDRSVGYLIWKLSNLMRGHLEARLNEIALHVGQMGALIALHEQPAASTADLARDLHMTPQNLSLMMTRFTKEGWVQRKPHQTHGRIQQLELTARGRQTMEAAVSRARGLDQTMLAEFSRTDREKLPGLLRRCLTAMEAEVAHDTVAHRDRWGRSCSPNTSPRRRGSKSVAPTEGR